MINEIFNFLRKPETIVFVDSSGTYHAGALLSKQEERRLRSSYKVIEIRFQGKTKESSLGNLFDLISPKNGSQSAID